MNLRKTKIKKNIPIRIASVLLCMTMLSTYFVSGLYARYTVSGQSGDSARVAAFVFKTEDKENSTFLNLSGIQKPGDSQSYTFLVSNQSGGAISEVAEKVQFSVQLNGSMPLVCTIAKEGGAQVLRAEIPENTTELPVEETADAGALPASTAQTDTYILTVVWPIDKSDVKYASRSAVAEVLLTVTAEQAD